jgi:hypothetical protein
VDTRWRLLDKPPSPELPQLLLRELKSTLEFFNKDPDQFRRRTLYRNAFACVEGILHYLKANTFSHYIRVVQPIVMFWKTFQFGFPGKRAAVASGQESSSSMKQVNGG